MILNTKGTQAQKRALNLTEHTATNFDLGGKARGLYLIKVANGDVTLILKLLIQ
jgi:hypothetical protein